MKTQYYPKPHWFFSFCGFAFAAPIVSAATLFTATLSPLQEVPPRASTATGSAVLILNDAMTALTMDVVVVGIDFTGLQTPDVALDNLTTAHIHAAAAGVNGPVVWGFFGAPFNDNNPNDIVITPSVTGVGGTISGKWDLPEGNNTTLGTQLPNLLAGNTYLNFHTQQFPGGEIRGQITPVPEISGTMGLLGCSLLGLCFGKAALSLRKPR